MSSPDPQKQGSRSRHRDGSHRSRTGRSSHFEEALHPEHTVRKSRESPRAREARKSRVRRQSSSVEDATQDLHEAELSPDQASPARRAEKHAARQKKAQDVSKPLESQGTEAAERYDDFFAEESAFATRQPRVPSSRNLLELPHPQDLQRVSAGYPDRGQTEPQERVRLGSHSMGASGLAGLRPAGSGADLTRLQERSLPRPSSYGSLSSSHSHHDLSRRSSAQTSVSSDYQDVSLTERPSSADRPEIFAKAIRTLVPKMKNAGYMDGWHPETRELVTEGIRTIASKSMSPEVRQFLASILGEPRRARTASGRYIPRMASASSLGSPVAPTAANLSATPFHMPSARARSGSVVPRASSGSYMPPPPPQARDRYAPQTGSAESQPTRDRGGRERVEEGERRKLSLDLERPSRGGGRS